MLGFGMKTFWQAITSALVNVRNPVIVNIPTQAIYYLKALCLLLYSFMRLGSP